MKTKYRWGNIIRLMDKYDNNYKKSEYAAQKIRDYFNTPEWHKIKTKNGFI